MLIVVVVGKVRLGTGVEERTITKGILLVHRVGEEPNQIMLAQQQKHHAQGEVPLIVERMVQEWVEVDEHDEEEVKAQEDPTKQTEDIEPTN